MRRNQRKRQSPPHSASSLFRLFRLCSSSPPLRLSLLAPRICSLKRGAKPVKPASAPNEGLCAAAETAIAANEVAEPSAKCRPALESAAETGG